ncbi:MAG: InlB B-repeat-containing protein [Bacilli bacterium]|nr:InlB B-repeat-containing protein [Bacilli bacterium]
MNKILKVSLCSFIAFLFFFGGKITANAAQITYHGNGGTPDAVTLGVPNGIRINVETIFNASGNTLEKKGYSFEGWYDHQDWVLGRRITTATYYSGQHPNLYARWELEYYDIEYDLAGGTVDGTNPTTYHYKYHQTLVINPTREGYNFIGWTGTDLDHPTKTLVIGDEMTGDRSYTANWEPIEYNIEYNLDGGTVDGENPTSYTIEDENFTLINPTKDGYEFIGWTGSNGDTPELEVTVNTGDLENKSFTANYLKKVKLIVNYLDSSGNPIAEGATIDYLENDFYESPGAVEVEGYVLDNSRLPEESGEFGDEDITLNYYYKGLYTVKFDTNGGSTIDDLTNVVEGSEIDLASYEPTREGYIFLGWYDEGGNLVTTITVNEDRTLTAKWEEKATGATYGDSTETNGNPNTADNVLLYVIGLLLSLVILVTTNKLRKNS